MSNTDLTKVLLQETKDLREMLLDTTYERDRYLDMLVHLAHETGIFLDEVADGNNYGFDYHGLQDVIAAFKTSYQDIREANLDVFSL